ncbi:hypothetical protein BCV69DRAFT_199692 [Microstroma glucosiphilum]|uniref:PA14 domain-containing protein n=1 Tax=Pseudomicrostroma glucosiphilum TaxID=1684307 RepID=A0A316U6G2_9BASI|nr:hypothetical protein BCV69DRAFT_199692 [Pseudomicrostroma glucosiphilum]PWN20800.1 hypothetical protein BCV69DRAFT_199692 [Pseudomicrostroma glucosiphilum]
MRLTVATVALALLASSSSLLGVSAAAVGSQGNIALQSSVQLDQARILLRGEYHFCRRWLGPREPKTSLITVVSTRTVNGPKTMSTVTPTSTVTQTETVNTEVTITKTSLETSYITDVDYAATTTSYEGSFVAQKRSITKPKKVRYYPDHLLTEACLELLYGTTRYTKIVTKTKTSTLPGRVYKSTAKAATSTASAALTVTDTATSQTTTTATATTTVKDPSTSTVVLPEPTPDQSCGNAGMQWAYWYEQVDPTQTCEGNVLDTDYVSSTTPLAEGTAVDFAYQYTDSWNEKYWYPYDSNQQLSSAYFLVGAKSYLFAPLTGTYTFALSNSDDVVAVWVGDDAYSGYTFDNAGTYGRWCTTDNPAPYTVTLQAGEYYPLRILWRNAYGPGTYTLTVTDPTGTKIAGGSQDSNPFLVQQSCDGTSAPPFPAWGNEAS